MTIIDGKATAEQIKTEIAAKVAAIAASGKRVPHLSAILVGHDGGSETYVANKVRVRERRALPLHAAPLPRHHHRGRAHRRNRPPQPRPEVDGFIVQLPLPAHIDEQKVTEAILPDKDVDGFHPVNVGRMSIGLPGFRSATPAGIMELLRRYSIPTSGKHAVVLGRSNIVGKPMATLLMQKGEPGDCTVTVCHSRTPNIKEVCRGADILIAALGKPGFVTEDMVKPGAVVIDVGTTRVPDATRKSGFRLSGDVDFEHVAPKCSYITPVPGGVGPMTICSLMMNTMQAWRQNVARD